MIELILSNFRSVNLTRPRARKFLFQRLQTASIFAAEISFNCEQPNSIAVVIAECWIHDRGFGRSNILNFQKFL